MKALSYSKGVIVSQSSQQITMQDIATQSGVSLSTVSRVLNGSENVSQEKQAAVMAAVEALNYRPNVFAQGLARGASRTVGVLTQHISAPFFDAILDGVLAGLRGTGYSPLFADGLWRADREERSIQLLLDRQVDGLIVLGGATSNCFLREIAAQKPLVLVGRVVPELTHQSVLFDDFKGAYLATQHLIELGHRQIVHITGILEHEDALLRKKGYLQALEDAGIPINDNLILEGNFVEQSGVLAVEMLFNRGQLFSAIFAANDQMAYGARLALYRRGIRVPEDVSLVGYDDLVHSAYTTPPLTTIHQPAFQMGEVAANTILGLIGGEQPEIAPFKAELIVRNSTARHR
ncbi:MAG: LacI family DNA-binding transcriptional regulator [Ardenticatenales bacterium]|nr:LacI family DNA-binding transcriptional regulator [Ardenticatenales bacterium]